MREKLENISTTINEPISVIDLKNHVRIDTDDEDDLIEIYAKSARELAETFCNRVIASQQFKLTLDDFPGVIRLPKTPVISIDSFTYVDTSGNTQALTSNDYHFSNDEFDPVIVPPYSGSWPNAQDGYEKVVITFTCGMSSIPGHVKNAILMIGGDLYANRETLAPITVSEIPHTAIALLAPVRKVIA